MTARSEKQPRLGDVPLGYAVSSGDLLVRGLPALLLLFASERWSPDRLARWQERRLRRIVHHAAHHSPYYRDLFRENRIDPAEIRRPADLVRIPPLERVVLQEQGARLIAEGGRRNPRLSAAATSGSTGMPLRIVVDRAEATFSLALLLFGMLRCGVRPKDRLAYFWAGTTPQPAGFGRWLAPVRETRLDLRRGPPRGLDDLAELRPHAIYGFPSFLALLAEEMQRRRRAEVTPRVIVTHGEVLSPLIRRRLEEAFRCPVRNTYGSAEFNRLAFERRCGFMHWIPLAAIVEAPPLGERGECGEALVTSLYHRRMPLIRYRLGDRLALADGGCACGSPYPRIARLEGRTDDFLTLPSGRRVSARAVNLLEDAPGLLEHQIVQRDRGLIDVLVRVREGGPPPDDELIRGIVRDGCLGEPVEIRVMRVGSIPRTAAGKLQAVVSEIR